MGLRSITTDKASGDDGISVELFQILKDDAVKVLHSICQHTWKTQNRILKSRDITLSTKIHLAKTMVFPVVMYRCERWTIKKAEH